MSPDVNLSMPYKEIFLNFIFINCYVFKAFKKLQKSIEKNALDLSSLLYDVCYTNITILISNSSLQWVFKSLLLQNEHESFG